MTGRAHCQRQVAFSYNILDITLQYVDLNSKTRVFSNLGNNQVTTGCEIPANSKVLHETKCKQVKGYAEGNFPSTIGAQECVG